MNNNCDHEYESSQTIDREVIEGKLYNVVAYYCVYCNDQKTDLVAANDMGEY